MQSRQDRGGDDSVTGSNVMPARTRELLARRVWNAGTEAGMWSPMVVVNHPLPHDEPKMPFVEHDQPIQTLSPDRADQPLAERIRLRHRTGVFSTVSPIAVTASSTAAA
jgi:hypothetical protein